MLRHTSVKRQGVFQAEESGERFIPRPHSYRTLLSRIYVTHVYHSEPLLAVRSREFTQERLIALQRIRDSRIAPR